jgi:hypothetical protein
MKSQPNNLPRLNPWPVSIISFFVIAIVGCVSFVAFCSRHPADLVAADYYEQEVHYQAQINRSHSAGQHAQPASVTYYPTTRRVVLALPPNSSPSQIAGKIQFYRPSAINLDRQFKLEPNSDGVQTIDATSLPPGLWKVRVSWTIENQDYFIDQKLIIGPKSL